MLHLVLCRKITKIHTVYLAKVHGLLGDGIKAGPWRELWISVQLLQHHQLVPSLLYRLWVQEQGPAVGQHHVDVLLNGRETVGLAAHQEISYQQLTVVDPLEMGVLHRRPSSPLDFPRCSFYRCSNALTKLEVKLGTVPPAEHCDCSHGSIRIIYMVAITSSMVRVSNQNWDRYWSYRQ